MGSPLILGLKTAAGWFAQAFVQELEGCSSLILRNPGLLCLFDVPLLLWCDTGWVCPNVCRAVGAAATSTDTVQHSSPSETEMMSWQEKQQQ